MHHRNDTNSFALSYVAISKFEQTHHFESDDNVDFAHVKNVFLILSPVLCSKIYKILKRIEKHGNIDTKYVKTWLRVVAISTASRRLLNFIQ